MKRNSVIPLLLLIITYALSPIIPYTPIKTLLLLLGFFIIGFPTALLLSKKVNISTFIESYVLSYALGVLVIEVIVLILSFLKLFQLTVPLVSVISAILSLILLNRNINIPELSKKEIMVILYSITVFTINTLTLNVNIVHMPDEYQYVYVARNMMLDNILCMTNYPIMPPSRIIRPAYHLINVYIFSYNDLSFYPSQIYSTLVHSMIIPATYILISQLGYGSPVIASLLIGVNPIMIWHSRKVLTDITYTFYFIVTLYFLLRIFNENLDKKSLLLFFIFYTLAFFTKISLVLAIPPLIYYSLIKSYRKYLIKNILFFIVPLIVLSELYLAVIVTPREPVEAPASTPEWSKSMLMQFLEPFTYSLDEWHHFLFEDWGKAHGTFVFPYYYSHAVGLLILSGFLRFIIRLDKEKLFIVFLTGMYIWYFSTMFTIGEARMVFPVYPILMMFASIMLNPVKNKYVYALLPLAFLVLPYKVESENTFIIQGISRDCIIISKTLATITLLLIILYSYLHRVKIVLFRRYPLNIIYCTILTVLLLSSLHGVNCILYRHLFPENTPVEETGIIDAARYLQRINLLGGIATNIFFELPYYMNYTAIY
ncbi:MAG: hypothetical protein DRJ32_07280, partial [Thermoprotei archaeon]